MRSLLLAVLLLVALPAAAGAQAANPLPPGADTGGATDITQTTATVHGTVDPSGAQTTYRFQYGTSTSYGLTSATETVPAGDAGVAVQAPMTRLTAATTYHYRLVATNAAGTISGADRSFRTAAPPRRPAVSTVTAADVTPTAVTLQGRVDPNGQATTYVFDYGTSTGYGATTPAGQAGAGDSAVAVSAGIAGLAANTTYHVRLRATNATGVTTGADRTLRTAKVPLGLAVSASAPSVRYGSALTITGVVSGTDRRGVALVLERRGFPFTTGFRAFGTPLSTDPSGLARFAVPPFTTATQFRITAPSRGGLASNVVTVSVRALVRLRARRLHGGRLRLFGTVAPGGAVGTASVQVRRADGRYVTVRRLPLRAERDLSRFSTIVRRRGTTTTYRIVTRLTGGGLADGRSLPRRLAAR